MGSKKTATVNDEVRAQLLAARARLAGQDDRISKHLREGIPADSEEAASALSNDEVLSALDARGRAEIAKIDATLARMDAGTWGSCASCGKAIDDKRLAAMPTSDLCRGCAAR